MGRDGYAQLSPWDEAEGLSPRGKRLREGVDFKTQAELGRLTVPTSESRRATAEELRLGGLLKRLWRDLGRYELSGEWPEGEPLSRQTWWRTALWMVFWQARTEGQRLRPPGA